MVVHAIKCMTVYITISTYIILYIINNKRCNTLTELYTKLYGSKNYKENTYVRWSDSQLGDPQSHVKVRCVEALRTAIFSHRQPAHHWSRS